MKYRSTRHASPALPFSEGLLQSLAPDGGLYVPASFPSPKSPEALLAESAGDGESVAAHAERLIAPFLAADELAPQLATIVQSAFDFPLPLQSLGLGSLAKGNATAPQVLELFHGPTAAFKDVGARFLAGCVSALSRERSKTILVATSGDTGGAVAAAFHGKPHVQVRVLFPKGKVSPRQQQQLTCFGDNIRALSVLGDFDACQALVKAAFAEPTLRAKHGLLAANSISIARLVPQMVYYATSSLIHLRATGRSAGYLIPSGNLGNAVAAFWAQKLGYPIREIVLCTNANAAISAYFASGDWQGRPTQATLANAMDVGNPSNMERLRDMFPTLAGLQAVASAYVVDDTAIRAELRRTYDEFGYVMCPHTAVAMHAWRTHVDRTQDWIVVATAHPAKFETIVEPVLGTTITVPHALAQLLDKPSQAYEIQATLSALADFL